MILSTDLNSPWQSDMQGFLELLSNPHGTGRSVVLVSRLDYVLRHFILAHTRGGLSFSALKSGMLLHFKL